MPFDSTADLLFRIGAETDDAEGNIGRFRALLGKDLSDLQAEFHSWSEEVFGDMSTLKGALTGGAAAFAAAAAAVGAFLVEAAETYDRYVEQVEEGSKRTGIAADEMSKLQFAAKLTGTNLDSLTRGLTFFESAIVKANAGSEQQAQSFARLGITQAQLAAGERDVLPLLEQVMDRFKGLSSGTERAAMARELFSRRGTEMLQFLSLGSAGLREMAAEAERLGMVITEDDITAFREHKAATEELKMSMEAFSVTIGREVLPYLTVLVAEVLGAGQALRETAKDVFTFQGALAALASGGSTVTGEFFSRFMVDSQQAMDRIERLVKTMEAAGHHQLDNAAKAKQASQEFFGLSELLDEIKRKTAAATDEEAALIAEVSHLQLQIGKTIQEFQKAQAEGHLAADAAKREADALVNLTLALPAMIEALQAKIEEKRKEKEAKQRAAEAAAIDDLQARMTAQREHTLDEQIVLWNQEIDKLHDKYAKEGVLTDAAEKMLGDLRVEGEHRIQREKLAAFQAELQALGAHLAKQVELQMTSTERLKFQHETELADLAHEEEEKTKLLEKGSAERLAVEQYYGILRQAMDRNYQADLNALQNSQGWQGVFGSKFAELLKRDEAATREWATSAQQSHLMVKLSLEALNEMAQETFQQWAEAEGQGIASAIVYSKSIGEAFRSATAAALESMAARAFVEAIYSTAVGFIHLAEGDVAGATAAFTAAGYFAAVGGAAALAGRAIAPKQNASSSGAGAGSSAVPGGGNAVTGQQGGTAAGGGGPHVTVVVQGHLVGWNNLDEFASAMNDAVLNRNVQLTASNTTTGRQVRR